jgi:hypothetical protein
MKDDTQLEADSHSIIVPLEQFFNNEPKFNEVQVISKKQPQTGHTILFHQKKNLWLGTKME